MYGLNVGCKWYDINFRVISTNYLVPAENDTLIKILKVQHFLLKKGRKKEGLLLIATQSFKAKPYSSFSAWWDKLYLVYHIELNIEEPSFDEINVSHLHQDSRQVIKQAYGLK